MDDVGAAVLSGDIIDNFVANLQSHGFKLTKEGTFLEYLGIKFEEDKSTETIALTWKGLIQKNLAATGMTNCNLNLHQPLLPLSESILTVFIPTKRTGTRH